ncbi:hypothetical protein Dsin_021020 [Dipteronia sinensis]|uniref:xylose isomerase n=1 Tax=Dipteronia sinensis TaxID=43782 RepID=A0AAE0AB37_9ROSI|nr:hypothetical protein Dsin_021020 [Dipteronia sinensis]
MAQIGHINRSPTNRPNRRLISKSVSVFHCRRRQFAEIAIAIYSKTILHFTSSSPKAAEVAKGSRPSSRPPSSLIRSSSCLCSPDLMRFSVAFWHTFRGSGADPFGSATKNWPWEDVLKLVYMHMLQLRSRKPWRLPNTQLILPTAIPKAILPTGDPKAIPSTAQQCQTGP